MLLLVFFHLLEKNSIQFKSFPFDLVDKADQGWWNEGSKLEMALESVFSVFQELTEGNLDCTSTELFTKLENSN